MKGPFVLLWLEPPVLSYHPTSFNMEIRARSTAAHSMITCLVVFLSSLTLCGSRVSTFNRLGTSVYGAFIMATEQSGLSLHQFGWAVEINQKSSSLPQIAHHTAVHSFGLGDGKELKKKQWKSGKEWSMQLQAMHKFSFWRCFSIYFYVLPNSMLHVIQLLVS